LNVSIVCFLLWRQSRGRRASAPEYGDARVVVGEA
jgi:hypothetical protein